MGKKSALEKIKPLLKEPAFTSEEARKMGLCTQNLLYYVKSGVLERLDRGVYRSVHAPEVSDFRWEDLATAAKRTKGGVICLTSALVLYELTEEIPRQHWIAVRNTTRSRARGMIRIMRFRNMDLGRTEIKLGNVTLPIFDRERTIVDAFRHLSVEVAVKALRKGLALRGKNKVDIKKINEYAQVLSARKIYPFITALTT